MVHSLSAQIRFNLRNPRSLSIAFCLVVLMPLSYALSQPPPPRNPPSSEERLKHVSEKIEKEITLTTAQKEKVKMAYKEFFSKMDELRKKGKDNSMPPPPPPPPPVKKEDMDKIVALRDEKIKGALNAAQYKKYQEVEKTLHPPAPGGPGGPPPMNK